MMLFAANAVGRNRIQWIRIVVVVMHNSRKLLLHGRIAWMGSPVVWCFCYWQKSPRRPKAYCCLNHHRSYVILAQIGHMICLSLCRWSRDPLHLGLYGRLESRILLLFISFERISGEVAQLHWNSVIIDTRFSWRNCRELVNITAKISWLTCYSINSAIQWGTRITSHMRT